MMTKDRIYCVLGHKCNNNCLFCAVDSETNRNRSLTNAEIIGFIDSLRDRKNIEIEISGGEPTCRSELFYFLDYLRLNCPHIRFVLLTNGRNFSNVGMAARLSDLNPYTVLIPINGDTPKLHDRISGSNGSFNETMHGIRNLYDYNVYVCLKTVVTGLNYRRMPQIVEMIAGYFPECPGITINGLDVLGKALLNKDLIGVRLRDAAPYVEKAIDAANDYGLKIKVYSIPPCVLGEGYRTFCGTKVRHTVISMGPEKEAHRARLTYGTVDKCRGCRYFDECTGTWYSYFDAYGTDELKPVE